MSPAAHCIPLTSAVSPYFPEIKIFKFTSEKFLSKFRQKALNVRSTFEQLVPLPELKSLFLLNNEILSLGGALVERNEHCDSFLSRGTIQRRRDALLCQARAR